MSSNRLDPICASERCEKVHAGGLNTMRVNSVMKLRRMIQGAPEGRSLAVFLAVALAAAQFLGAPARVRAQGGAQAAPQETFPSPQDAMSALVQAVEGKDQSALAKIFGPQFKQLLSGDAVEDNKDLNSFAAGLQENAQLREDSDARYTLLAGKENWPTPIPIVKHGGDWMFDTQAGLEEILNRRIGENELSAINTCRAYVVAQWEYYAGDDGDQDGIAEYAQKFISSPGQHDGLYWETSGGEKPSPLGQLVADARAEGYGPANQAGADQTKTGQTEHKGPARERHPYHGYFFKILTRQGPSAPGGKFSYIINGNMIAGYALIAYPDKWGNSGVMTFIINNQGRVYQKNLGENTSKIASSMTEYNPDTSWKLVEAH
jgi:Protein of unknown function (DUF2950)